MTFHVRTKRLASHTAAHLVLPWLLAFGFNSIAVAQDPAWDGSTVVLESQKLADGVFAVIPAEASDLAPKGLPIATTGGFVMGDKGCSGH